MAEIVNVIVKEDPSVQKALDRTAKKLRNKYSKRRTINEKAIKSRTPFQVFTSVVLNVLTVLLVIFAGLVCVSSVNASINKVCPSFAGYSNFRIVSGSMVASGHKIGDTIIVRAVDTDTLKPQHYENGKFVAGDKIAFYQSNATSSLFQENSAAVVSWENIGERKYKFEFNYLFGTKNAEMVNAAQSGCVIVFHHILGVYEDESGVRWFRTYGSSNGLAIKDTGDPADTTANPDSWWVREDMVIGVYEDTPFAIFMSGVVGAFSSSGGVFLLFIPVGFLVFLIIRESVRDVQLAKLELDCVEEKRKITDEICVKNGIGYKMSKKTKYKILVQADEKDRMNYISLMWRGNTVPREVKKYVLRKQALMKPTQRLLEVNRQCQQMFREGVDSQKIAKYYAEEKAKVEAEETAIRKRVRELRKTYEAIYLADKAEQEKLLANKKNREKFETIPESKFLPEDDKRKKKNTKEEKLIQEQKADVLAILVESEKDEIINKNEKSKVVQKTEPKRKRRKLDEVHEQEKNKEIAKILLKDNVFDSKEEFEGETFGGVLVPKSLIEKNKKEQVNGTLKEEGKQELVEEIENTTEELEQIKDQIQETSAVENSSHIKEEIERKPVQKKKSPEIEEVAKVGAKEKKQPKDNQKSVDKKLVKKEAKVSVVNKPKVEKKNSVTESDGKATRKPRAKSKKVKRVFTADNKRLPRARKK